jgi:crossover junction endodeoxyribonuclease RuvC
MTNLASGATRILGIDPGTATVGWGVLDCVGANSYICAGTGIIQTPKEMNAAMRLKMIRSDLICLLEQFSPEVVAVEAIFFFKNAKTLVPVSQARGVILEACASAGLPYVEYTPMQVKLNLTGFGRADKKDVQFAVARLLNHAAVIKPDDANDALAIAICHARTGMFCKRVSESTKESLIAHDKA